MPASTLRSTIHFPGVAAGNTATLPHGLNVEGTGVIPDTIDLQSTGSFEYVSADATNVTVRNTGDAAADCYALCDYQYSSNRAYSPPAAQLSPAPFVMTAAAGGPAGSVSMPNITGGAFPTASREVVIYVRLAGNDITGDGTLTSPYATIHRALADVPQTIQPGGTMYSIDCSGMGTVVLASDILIPQYLGDPSVYYDYTAPTWRAINAMLNIRAEPTVLDTVTGGEIVAQTTNPTTGLKSVQTTKAWAIDQYKGKLIVGPTGSVQGCAIASNTADTLEITYAYNLQTPFQIVEPSTVLQSATYTPISVAGPACINLQGLGLQGAAGGTSLLASFAGFAQLWLCVLSNFSTFMNRQMNIFGCAINGDGALKTTIQDDQLLSIADSFFDQAVFTLFSANSRDAGMVFFSSIIADGCSPLGSTVLLPDTLIEASYRIYRAAIRNGTSHGVYTRGGTGTYLIKYVTIDSCAGNGALIEGPARAEFQKVTGTGNTGVGVKLTDGSLAKHRASDTTVTGVGGDYQVGGNAAAAGGGAGWGAFFAVNDENDLGAVTPQLCRMYR